MVGTIVVRLHHITDYFVGVGGVCRQQVVSRTVNLVSMVGLDVVVAVGQHNVTASAVGVAVQVLCRCYHTIASFVVPLSVEFCAAPVDARQRLKIDTRERGDVRAVVVAHGRGLHGRNHRRRAIDANVVDQKVVAAGRGAVVGDAHAVVFVVVVRFYREEYLLPTEFVAHLACGVGGECVFCAAIVDAHQLELEHRRRARTSRVYPRRAEHTRSSAELRLQVEAHYNAWHRSAVAVEHVAVLCTAAVVGFGQPSAAWAAVACGVDKHIFAPVGEQFLHEAREWRIVLVGVGEAVGGFVPAERLAVGTIVGGAGAVVVEIEFGEQRVFFGQFVVGNDGFARTLLHRTNACARLYIDCEFGHIHPSARVAVAHFERIDHLTHAGLAHFQVVARDVGIAQHRAVAFPAVLVGTIDAAVVVYEVIRKIAIGFEVVLRP